MSGYERVGRMFANKLKCLRRIGCGLIAWVLEAPSRSVYPSGSALATAVAATVLDAPGRFSTMNDWPRLFDNSCAMMRA